jgi:hypothetical protein
MTAQGVAKEIFFIGIKNIARIKFFDSMDPSK